MPLTLYRGIVKDAHDTEKRGKIGLFIPELQGVENNSKSNAIWAMPANSPFSGATSGSSNINCGSIIVPPEGTEVFCFLEDDNPEMCYYLCGPMYDNSNCMPIEGKVGSDYENNYVLMKSPKGRAIIVSDESTNQSIVIKGKCTASTSTLYQSGDMAVILDEGSKGNVITIQTGTGSQYIKLNKDSGEILIQNNSSVYIQMTSDSIVMKAPGIYFN